VKRRVQEAWVVFERQILPRDCSPVQRQETRRAFFAGAFVLMDTLAAAMSYADDMTQSDEQVLVDLAAEREEYLVALRTGRA
jgi:hypothetical protein